MMKSYQSVTAKLLFIALRSARTLNKYIPAEDVNVINLFNLWQVGISVVVTP